MRVSSLLFAGVLAPLALAAPTGDIDKREDLCKLKTPPITCQPDPTVSVEETALRAYKFYRAFVVDGDPRTMFSYIDSVYKVCLRETTHQPSLFTHTLELFLFRT